jgi:hypothetical protein
MRNPVHSLQTRYADMAGIHKDMRLTLHTWIFDMTFFSHTAGPFEEKKSRKITLKKILKRRRKPKKMKSVD